MARLLRLSAKRTWRNTKPTKKMNRVDRIDQLRNAGIEASTILDEMTRWFSEDDIKEFFDDFVRVHDVTFGEEEEEEESMGLTELGELIAQSLKEEEESQKITDEELEEMSKKLRASVDKWFEMGLM